MTKHQITLFFALVCVFSFLGGIVGAKIFVKHPYFYENEPLKLNAVKCNAIASKTIEVETLMIASKDKGQAGTISFLIDANGDPFMFMSDHRGKQMLKLP